MFLADPQVRISLHIKIRKDVEYSACHLQQMWHNLPNWGSKYESYEPFGHCPQGLQGGPKWLRHTQRAE